MILEQLDEHAHSGSKVKQGLRPACINKQACAENLTRRLRRAVSCAVACRILFNLPTPIPSIKVRL